ncbi:MAG: prolipoprotein diacylglyceryl transferase [Coriobacteriales bacterium]|jgi:phosphatidylglycerol:prolipoprotein diacylglycerol transferase|nr:prolipoprotein diacylglyceryl transferase [Coriobacteriales bacterium]
MLDALYQSLDPVAFSIGPFVVRWYGISYMLGFLLAAILALRIARRWEVKLSVDGLLTIVIACMIGTILGGRLGYVLFYGNGYYFSHPAEIFAFSQGGMSFHGGLIGFAIGLILAARIIRFPVLGMGDIAAICVPVALGLVRIANFVNGELWGATTTLPWGVVFEGAGDLPRHPTQLYEALLEGPVLLIVLYLLARRKPPLPQASYFGIFLIGYAVFRIAVEFVRQPDAHIGYLFGTDWVTMGMTLSLPMALVGAGFLVYASRTRRPQGGQGTLAPKGGQPPQGPEEPVEGTQGPQD